MARRKLYKSDDGVLLGVCQGVADWLGVPVAAIRLIVIIVAICTKIMPCLMIYLFFAIFLPARPACEYSFSESGSSDCSGSSYESEEEYRRRKREAEWDNKFCNS